MSLTPFFSIIIPTYNAEKTLETALDSILKQTFSDFEVIVVDGQSVDSTQNIAQKFKDARVRMKIEKDNGVYDAMNKGILLSKGEWLYFLGSDDLLYDERVLSDIKNQISKEDDIIYGNVISEPLNGLYDGAFTMEKLFNRNICHQSIFIRRPVFEKTGLFDLKYKMQSDWDQNIKWFLDNSLRKKFVDRIVALYAGTGLSSQVRDLAFEKDKTQKFLRFSQSGFSRTLKQHLNLAQAIERKENGDYTGFLFYKFRYLIIRFFE
jgi:glycosyltransferase involved in cell wall biosynthesis